MNHNLLAPRLVALSKDSALGLYLEKWQDPENISTYKDVISMFSSNNIDDFEKSVISIKKEFITFSLPELAVMIESTYSSMEELVKDTLRFVGRENEGPGVDKFEWGHSHPH